MRFKNPNASAEKETILPVLWKEGEVGMRLIDADALADVLFDKRKNYPQWVADTIGKMPDAVVRCKDCQYAEVPILNYFKNTHRYCTKYELTEPKDWFCADGERKGS